MPDVPLQSGRSGGRRWMMRLSIGALIVLGLGGIIWFKEIKEYLQRQPIVATPPEDLQEIVVPRVKIAAFETISNADLSRIKKRREDVPSEKGKDGKTTYFVVLDGREVIGRVTLEDLDPGEMIFTENLAPAGKGSGIAAAMDPGYAAVTLEAARIQGVQIHMLKRGMGVGVIARWDSPRRVGNQMIIAEVLSRSAKVLVPCAKPGDAGPTANQITLQVPASEVYRITEALQGARINLVVMVVDGSKPSDLKDTLQDIPQSAQDFKPPWIERILGDRSSSQPAPPEDLPKKKVEPTPEKPEPTPGGGEGDDK